MISFQQTVVKLTDKSFVQIYDVKMGMLPLTLILNVGLVFTLATALYTNEDIGDCSEATPHDRLTHIEPLKYNVKLNIRVHYKNIIGESKIRIRIAKTTRVVALHAYGLQIDEDAVVLTKFNRTWAEDAKNGNGENGKIGNGDIVMDIYKPESYRYCTASQILEIHFDKDMHRGYYDLYIPFVTPFSEFEGFIQYPYLSEETNKRWLFTTFMEPNGARKVFPCWDEMAMKAFFNISVQHSSHYIVFSNTPIRQLEEKDTDDVHVTHFHPTAAISPSLVMITMINNIINCPIEFAVSYIWHREEVTDSLRYTRSIIEMVKQYLSLTTDVQEKKRKTNFLLIPNSPMKSIGCCGLYLYREQDLTYDEKTDFSGRKIAIARLLAHSISRRWFLGVVSPFWQTDSWLGEALATYFSHYTVAKMLQNAMYIHLYVVQILQPTLHYDTELKMKSIAEMAKSTAEINANEIDMIFYSRLSYNKGSVLIRMLQHFLGVENFRDGIDRYVRKYKSSSATTDDFWQIMQEIFDESGRHNYNIKEMMDTWLTGRQYPVVSFDYNYNISTATISISCDNDNWIIPVSYTMSNFASKSTASRSTGLEKLKCSQSKIINGFKLEDMIIINRNQVGYYRVNYDNKNWRKISSHLRYNNYTNIHVLNRAAFIDDVYHFMMKGELEVSTFFNIIKYLKREMDFVAWYPMFNILSYMSEFFKQPEHTFVIPHMLDILDALLNNVGYEEDYKDADMMKALRLLGLRWACKLGHAKCQEVANAKLTAHIMDPAAHPILPWWKDWVYCTGIETANLSIWHQVLHTSMRSKDFETLMHLTCSNEAPLLIYYLDFLVSNNGAKELTDHQRYSIYHAIIKKHAQKDMVLNFIMSKYKEIMSSFDETLTMILGDAIMNLKSSEQFDMIRGNQLFLNLFVVKHLQLALNNEEDLGMIQVIDKFDFLDEIDDLFHNRLYYNKVASLLRLLHYMFPKDFNKGIVQYVKEGTNNFSTIMQSFNLTHFKDKHSLKTTMDTWVKEKYYPELYVHRDYYNNIATCYYSLPHSENFKWNMPITSIVQSDLIYYNVSIGNLTINWLKDAQLIISDIPRNDFIIVNIEQLGYYRVNYNNQNWRRIYSFLNYNNFTLVPVLNRAQLINDAYYFATNGKLDSAIFFRLIEYLKQETDYLAWYPMFNIFLHMSAYLECLEGEFAKTQFVNILDGLVSNLGYDIVPKNKTSVIPTKTALTWLGMKWACKIGHVGCRDNATKSLIDYVQSREKYKQDHELRLWLKDWVFCTGMMRVNMRFWEKIKKESIANTNSELLHYLHCANNDTVILSHLLSLVTTDFGKNPRLNIKDVYRSIVKQNGKKYIVVFYVISNYEDIKKRLNISDIELLGELIMNSYYPEHLSMIEGFSKNKAPSWGPSVACNIEILISARRKQLAKILDKFKYL
ncbi:glutamyl aminopeptidase-like [Odontomachus brunneus]|uniref:glutamyl aminopeptidase-like n=1 Tax=Odontomachus brunneus TaxID=486640 RepID=UPI0013F2A253|nr:glutamyl aminopeptidase-like [Odontomachus brunneus]